MKWLSEADLDFFTAEFERRGFRNGLNYYRCLDLSWELMRSFRGRRIEQPSLFVRGEFDLPQPSPTPDEILATLRPAAPGLRRAIVIEGCGHWVQQERPDAVNAALLAFLEETSAIAS